MTVKNTGKYGRFWEMKQGGPNAKNHREIFKCTGCGGETKPANGFNGEPDIQNCAHDCASRSDWNPGRVSKPFKDHYDAIFRKTGEV